MSENLFFVFNPKVPVVETNDIVTTEEDMNTTVDGLIDTFKRWTKKYPEYSYDMNIRSDINQTTINAVVYKPKYKWQDQYFSMN